MEDDMTEHQYNISMYIRSLSFFFSNGSFKIISFYKYKAMLQEAFIQ